MKDHHNRRVWGHFEAQTGPFYLLFANVEEVMHYSHQEKLICTMVGFDYGRTMGIRFKVNSKGLFYLRDIVYVPWLMTIKVSIKEFRFSWRCLEELADRIYDCSLNFFIAQDIVDPQNRDHSVPSLKKLLVDELRKYVREHGGLNGL